MNFCHLIRAFGACPSLVPQQFVEKLLATGPHLLGTSHRKKPIKDLCKGIQDGVKEFFSLPEGYSVVLGNGGATLLFDMIGLGMVNKKVSIIPAESSVRSGTNLTPLIPWIETEEIAVDFGNGNSIQNHDDADMICATLNETSTGVIINELPEVVPDTILAIDATSGGGQVPCDLSKVDLFSFPLKKYLPAKEDFLWQLCHQKPESVH